jgi:predicted nucleic acid-binding protein
MADKGIFLLDTSALLALRGDEPGADRVESLLSKSKSNACVLLVSFMSRMELLYLIWREEAEEAAREALRLVDFFEIEWVSGETEILELASRLKAKGRLSVADSWIGATAIAREATLVHKDPEFAKFKEISQELIRK